MSSHGESGHGGADAPAELRDATSGEEYNPGAVTEPRQAATVILLRGGARSARGAARAAYAQGALHGRRVGVSRRRRRRSRGRRRPGPPSRRDPRAARGGGDRARGPRTRSSSSRAGSRPAQVKIRFDTHFFLAPLPAGQEPAGRRRGGASTSAGSRRGGAAGPPRREDRARLPHDQAPRAAQRLRLGRTSCSSTRAGATCSRSSRRSCSRARSPAIVLPGDPGY